MEDHRIINRRVPKELLPFSLSSKELLVPVTPPHLITMQTGSQSNILFKKVDIGGYDYTFVDKEKLPDECTCPICTLVQRDAHQVICCGKIYCKSCLDEMKSKSYNFNCPNCRKSLRGMNKYFPDTNTISKIRHFAIYCENKDKGCKWKGHLKDFEEGHLQTCSYQIVECSNDCEAKMQRQELDRHLKEECPRRQFTCPLCKTCGEYRNITGDHIRECPDYILECPNTGCDKSIKRSQMTQHHKECPKEIVTCHHSSIGCNTRIKREEILSHHKECMSSHLDLAIKEIHELRQEIHEVRQDQKCMSSHLDSVVKKLGFDIRMLRAQTFKIPVIKMQNYSRNKAWISPGFYVSTGSYKMALKVTTNKPWIKDYLSCYLAIMPGENDNTLDWPFQGEVTVELLNQKEDRNHVSKIFYFNKDTPYRCKNRVVPRNTHGEWWGPQDVIDKYYLDPYLGDNDTLHFRISVKINTNNNKSWLV